MRGIWKDVAVATRVFRRSPGLAASVAATIALGVGASLAIFGLLHDALVGQSPFRDPGSLVVIENTGLFHDGDRELPGVPSPHVSWLEFADLESQSRSLTAVGATAQFSGLMTGADRPRPVWRTLVTPKLFPLLGARPSLGRLLDPGDFAPGAAPAAVLTESMWRRHFRGDAGAVGRAVRIDDQPFTIVGVVPDAALRHLNQPKGLLDRVQDRQVITPLLESMAGAETRIFRYLQHRRDAGWLLAIGRAAPGRTAEVVAREIAGIGARLAAAYPGTNGRRGLRATPLETWRTSQVRGTTTMLLAAALLVFLVASCNAAGLVLADSVRHETEAAVRQALGAGPTQLVRLEFLRSIVLALPGGILALVCAALTLLVVDRSLADGSGAILQGLFVPRVFVVGAATTAAAGLIAGAGAAWSLRRRRVAEALKEGGPTSSAGRRRQFATRGLVALQVAGATVLVLGAGLMLRSVWNIVGVDLGYDVRHTLVMQVRLPPARYPNGAGQRAFFQQALRRIRAIPGVAAAGGGTTAPLTGTASFASGIQLLLPSGGTISPGRLDIQIVMPGYLEALGMKLLRGRWFNDSDFTTLKALVVDQAFCRKYLGNADPLLTQVQTDEGILPIVGVVAGIRRDGPLEKPVEMLYVMEDFKQAGQWSHLLVRSAGRPADLGEKVLRELAAIDPAVSAEDPRPLDELLGNTFATRRRLLLLLGSAAVIVLLLTAFGLASALAQYVAAREREMAIRLALGGGTRHLAGLLGRHVAAAVILGLAAGAAGGVILARTLASELYGVQPTDPVVFAEAVAALALLAGVAAAVPVWRACRIDPTTALRAQ